MTKFTIETLNIRLRGVPLETANSISSKLSDQLRDQLRDQHTLINEKSSTWIDLIDAGVIQSEYTGDSSELCKKIASKIINSIITSSNRTKEEEY